MSNPTHPVKSNGHADYERKDIGVGGVVAFLIGLGVFLVIAYFLADGFYKVLDKHFEAEQAPVSPLVSNAQQDTRRIPPQYGADYDKYLKEGFPAPQLETDERTELNDIRLREENILSTYDYVDKNAGTVRVPIDRAMDLLAQRGLPVRSQTGGATSPTATPQPEKMKGSKR
jgi:hypothetical protein